MPLELAQYYLIILYRSELAYLRWLRPFHTAKNHCPAICIRAKVTPNRSLFGIPPGTSLRKPDSYDDKIAKICNLWTFWPVNQPIKAFCRILKRLLLVELQARKSRGWRFLLLWHYNYQVKRDKYCHKIIRIQNWKYNYLISFILSLAFFLF